MFADSQLLKLLRAGITAAAVVIVGIPPAQAQGILTSNGYVNAPTLAVPDIILDNDGGTDIDNATSLRMFGRLANLGLINPIAYIASDADPYNASAAKVLRNFTLNSYPIYAYQGSQGQTSSAWTQPVTNQFNPGDNRTNYTDCEEGYRQLLGAAANSSIIIAMAGPATCVDLLLESPSNYNGDGLGTGLSLIEAKVKFIIWGAGTWPSGTADFNMTENATATADLISNWPSTVPFYFYGVNLTTGATGPLSAAVCQTSTVDPFLLAFFSWEPTSNPCLRTAWDETPLMYPVPTLAYAFSVTGANGTVTFNSGTGANTWTSTTGPFSYLGSISQTTLTTLKCGLEQIYGTDWCAAGVVPPGCTSQLVLAYNNSCALIAQAWGQ